MIICAELDTVSSQKNRWRKRNLLFLLLLILCRLLRHLIRVVLKDALAISLADVLCRPKGKW